MDLKEVVAVNLRRLRHAKDMTQEELAEKAGLSARYIGGIERANVSATGHGEIFIRYAVAHEIAARIRLGGQTLVLAAADVVAELQAAGEHPGLNGVVAELRSGGGNGGLIAVDAFGQIAMPFNCEGMFRGAIFADAVPRTGIYKGKLRAE